MFPEIPSDLSQLSTTDLRAFCRQIKAAVLAIALDAADDVKAEGVRQMGIRAALLARIALLSDDADDEPEVDETDTTDETDETDSTDESEEELSTKPPAVPAAPKVPVTTGQPGMSGRDETPAPKKKMPLSTMTAYDGLEGKRAGAGIESWSEAAALLVERAGSISPGTTEKFGVISIKGNYDAAHTLSDDMAGNFSRMFGSFDETEVTAALCAPATPVYDIHCQNALARPAMNSLPGYQAPRMKVSIMPSPTLADIVSGVGIWTAANEASTNAVKSACQTITCGSPTEYQAYGIYRCMTVRNMLAMSYPELVEGWLNRLAAAQARMAEIAILNAMGTASTAVTAPLLGYGASTTIASTILNYIALVQETQRWDITENMEGWAHRWLLAALKMEIIRRRNTSGQMTKVPSTEDINRMFADVGVNIHWVMDSATWMEPLAPVVVGGNLSRFPPNANILLAAPGKFALIDRGDLRIGVTGNNIYRDNNSNARNEFTYFFESFEGVVDTGRCVSHVLTIPVCLNGAQVDDVLVNCQGGDEVGFGS